MEIKKGEIERQQKKSEICLEVIKEVKHYLLMRDNEKTFLKITSLIKDCEENNNDIIDLLYKLFSIRKKQKVIKNKEFFGYTRVINQLLYNTYLYLFENKTNGLYFNLIEMLQLSIDYKENIINDLQLKKIIFQLLEGSNNEKDINGNEIISIIKKSGKSLNYR